MKLREPHEIVHKGVKLSDALEAHWLWEAGRADGARLDWPGADLGAARLTGANLTAARLAGANLSGARLDRADLSAANLNDASLNGARLLGANLTRASLNGATLLGANLLGASLNGASLSGATGNTREVKSAQFDRWPLTWTRDPEGITTLQIGCQSHPLGTWRKAEPRWIAAMDPAAAEWWVKYRDIVLRLVDAAPAVPWGRTEVRG